jgi:hypothetical protein
MAPLYLALVHYPVMNRNGEVIASAITNLDLHDLARLSCTYEVPVCYIVTPLKDQQDLAQRLTSHWRDGVGRELHPDRERALRRLRVVDNISVAVDQTRTETGVEPAVWATTARGTSGALTHEEASRLLNRSSRPHLLMLGTGWGLASEALVRADAVLEEIRGVDGYNHLSVRCAAAILLDRLLR